MTAYALAHLREGSNHPDVFEYLERIQSTLDPYSGRFLAHGNNFEVLEGNWPGHVIIIGFPDMAEARAWYESPAYQEILPLRTRHIEGDVILVGGVGPGYDAAAKVVVLKEAERQRN
jgi:uncharacterized protein (DUF1330 family)